MDENLDFYNKEIANIQQQLLDKLDNLVAGLGQVTDTELMQIAKQIDFFAEMDLADFLFWRNAHAAASGAASAGIPEPASAALALLGAVAFATLRKRR